MTTDKEKARVEQLKGQKDVREALKQTAATKEIVKPVVETGQKVWLGIYLLLLVAFGSLYYLLRLGVFNFTGKYLPLLQRLTLGMMAIVLVLGVAKTIDLYVFGRLDNAATRYNLRRILKLLLWLILAIIAISIIFANWYTTVVSLGLISLILGFALQTPITSFIGWVYILVRAPYRVGNRIRIGEATGDVIDVSYLDTTLWEFGGEYLSTDHPSGRIIKFPNSKVLNTAVYNYSWPLFPYIWNEISFQVAYDSDLEFVAKIMQETAEEELGPAMIERVRTFRELLAHTTIDQLEVREHPAVFFRINANTWVEATVRYIVEPKQAGRVKTRLIKKMLERLNSEPERAKFPKSNLR
jgi:small-conductance mechanosensitive channel